MMVQIARCSAAQLFSGCLLLDDSPASDVIVTGGEATVAGELTIPDCQRAYCWHGEQLYGLLLDIEYHVDRKIDRDIDLPYYLGSLIPHQQAGKQNISDGQQCITTPARMDCLPSPGAATGERLSRLRGGA